MIMTNSKSITVAILIGVAMVAGSIMLTDGFGTRVASYFDSAEVGNGAVKRLENRAVYGDPLAATTIVEFSDFECPFCGRLHPTLKKIVDESNGQVNWEYRHFPLPNHRSAELAATVAECVLREKGNAEFWLLADEVFANQKLLEADYLATLAGKNGLSKMQFDSCLQSTEIAEQIKNDMATAQALGGSGTPFSVVVYEDGTIRPVSGALPYDSWLPLLQ